MFDFGAASRSEGDRVAPGGFPPGAPTDPYVRDYRIRFLSSDRFGRQTEWIGVAEGRGYRSRRRLNQSQFGRRRCRRRSHLNHVRTKHLRKALSFGLLVSFRQACGPRQEVAIA